MNKLKFIVVAGTRPNFIKIAPLLDRLKKYRKIKTLLVNTEQHYDYEMSELFFKELDIPKPDYTLGVKNGSHASQTARIMEKLEGIFLKEKPDLVIVVGDVNSTLAAAITAVKTHIKLAHIEAGQRSFDRDMPEEINRILVDSIADLLFVSIEKDRENLLKEGKNKKNIFLVGNIMTDTLLRSKAKALSSKNDFLKQLMLEKENYGLMTIHRAGNTDNRENLKNIIEAANEVAEKIKIIFPIHPRTKKMISRFGLGKTINRNPNLVVINPVSYSQMIELMLGAKLVLTDSGGLQHETTVLNIPCLTIKKTTEWPITVGKGTNIIVGLSKEKIISEALKIISGKRKRSGKIRYWDGKTSERIVKILIDHYGK